MLLSCALIIKLSLIFRFFTVLLCILLPLHPFLSQVSFGYMYRFIARCCCENSWPLVYAVWFFVSTFFQSHPHILFHTCMLSCTQLPWCWWGPLGFWSLSMRTVFSSIRTVSPDWQTGQFRTVFSLTFVNQDSLFVNQDSLFVNQDSQSRQSSNNSQRIG